MTAAFHQATCVAIEDRGLLIEGPPGAGKSGLALALIDRGAALVGDDGVLLDDRGGAVFATPVPATRGLLEVRTLGLLPFPCADAVAIAVVIDLDPAAERWIEAPGSCRRSGVSLPLVRLWPGDPLLPLKAELALRHYGRR